MLGGKIGCEWICGTDFWYSYSAVGGVFLVATFWQSLVKNDFRKISVVKIGRKKLKISENCRTILYENAVFFRILRCGIALCAIYTSLYPLRQSSNGPGHPPRGQFDHLPLQVAANG